MELFSDIHLITTSELRAFVAEAYLLSLLGLVFIDELLRRAAGMAEPYALAIAIFAMAMACLPPLRVRARDKGRTFPTMRFVSASAAGVPLFIGLWFLLDRLL